MVPSSVAAPGTNLTQNKNLSKCRIQLKCSIICIVFFSYPNTLKMGTFFFIGSSDSKEVFFLICSEFLPFF